MNNSDTNINEIMLLRKRIKKEIRNIKIERIVVSLMAFVMGFVFFFIVFVFILIFNRNHEDIATQALKMAVFGGMLGFYVKYTDMKEHIEQSIENYVVVGNKMEQELRSKKEGL